MKLRLENKRKRSIINQVYKVQYNTKQSKLLAAFSAQVLVGCTRIHCTSHLNSLNLNTTEFRFFLPQKHPNYFPRKSKRVFYQIIRSIILTEKLSQKYCPSIRYYHCGELPQSQTLNFTLKYFQFETSTFSGLIKIN